MARAGRILGWLAAALATGCGGPASSDADRRWCEVLPRPEFAALERLATGSDWYQVYRIEPGVLAIAEPEQYQEVISYLILGRDRALLFDTGLGLVPIRPVVEELTSLPVTVLNSHTHYDHVGGNAEFTDLLAMDTDYTRANARGFPGDAVAGEVRAAAFCRRPAGFDSASYAIRPYGPTRYIRDGHRIDLGGRSLEVLHLPGHTPDAVGLVDSAAGILWTGDSFYLAPIWLYVPETDIDGYSSSVDRMVRLVPRLRLVLGAHNVAQAEPRRLEELRVALARVLGGELEPRDAGEGRVEFQFEGFSILTAPEVLARQRGDPSRGGSGLTTW
jgi:glyoxylase-like metal-dependent hydrolase (beta-lactamase superfamily II)